MKRTNHLSVWAVAIRIAFLIPLFALNALSLSDTALREPPAPDIATPDLHDALPWDIPEDAERMIVDEIVDGDTLRLTYPGNDYYYPTRLIGIQAPEMDGPYTRRECYGPEAKRYLTELLPVGTGVFVQKDITDEDRNGRRLRHVFVASPAISATTRSRDQDEDDADVYLLSEVLVLGGFAEARSYPPDDLYDDVLAEAEDIARDNRAGLWQTCAA